MKKSLVNHGHLDSSTFKHHDLPQYVFTIPIVVNTTSSYTLGLMTWIMGVITCCFLLHYSIIMDKLFMLTLFCEKTSSHVVMSLNKWMTIFTCTFFIHVTFFVVVVGSTPSYYGLC